MDWLYTMALHALRNSNFGMGRESSRESSQYVSVCFTSVYVRAASQLTEILLILLSMLFNCHASESISG